MKRFDQDLAALQDRMAEMARIAQSMVALAITAIKDRAQDVHDEIADFEKRLDKMQTEIDHDAVRLLTVYSPVATHLRYVLVVTHITAQLERIGDQVVNVCESLNLMQTDVDHRVQPELRKMSDLVGQMLGNAVASYFEKDAEKAETTRAQDDLVDALHAQIVKMLLSDEVLHGVLEGTRDIADALAQILIARHLERMADQAVNICKEVIYLVRGDDVRHAHRKTDLDTNDQ